MPTARSPVLRASSSRGTYVRRNGRLIDLGCAKVICSEEPVNAEATGNSVIEIPVTPSRKPLPILDPREQQQIADRFQTLLLMFRFETLEARRRFRESCRHCRAQQNDTPPGEIGPNTPGSVGLDAPL